MIAGISAVGSVVLGTSMAYLANRYPAYRTYLETAGGFLIIAGFGIIGFALRCATCSP
jgi:hypothetical protein